MDPFLIYLIVINVTAFLVYAIDFFRWLRNPSIEDSTARTVIIDLLPIAGGVIGALLALFIFTGLLSKRRMNKQNIAWWFFVIVCLVVWVLVVAVKFGFLTLDASIASFISGWDLDKLRILGIYLAAINVVTFIAFAWDKHVAKSGNDYGKRAPEARLLALCLIGGSVGGMIAMCACHHKTKKWYFVWGLPLFLILDVVVIAFAHMSGLI